MLDGEIVSSVQQERFDKIKNSGAFPKDAIDWTLKSSNITAEQIDAVAIGGLIILPSNVDLTPGVATPGKSSIPISTKLWREIDFKHPNLRPFFYPMVMQKREKLGEKGREEVIQTLKNLYNIPKEKIHFVEHHVCHAYTAYYGLRQNQKNDNNSLVLTLDGEGDKYCASVNDTKNNEINRIASTPWHASLGYIYSQTTTFLGMKALEHEYKVMGLAPYAKNYFLKTYEKLYKHVIDVDGNSLEFKSIFPTNRFIVHLKENAFCERFDNVAAAVQYLTEDLVTKWTIAAIKKTDCSDVYLGGGVFMNVKLNLKLYELDSVENIHPFPGCGDESNPFGAAYYVYINHFAKPSSSVKRIKNLYLGPEYSNDYIEDLIKKRDLKSKYKVEFHKDMEGEIASLLAKGKVVARVAGKSEWGPRSLGNRAIIGNPSILETFYKVNDQIKMRDFWMPFAPSILKERENDYIENPKGVEAPYMILAFNSTKLAHKDLRAAIHQADKTCRPQILEKDWNENYYKIIKQFENETGIGGVMNTSFNLHGEPMVCSPEDAIHTFEDSGLEYLAMENWLVSKNI